MLVCPECGLGQQEGRACPMDGTPLQPRGDDTIIGTTLGAYRVARLLGVGGMGRVYKGVHPTIGSRVAIKVLSYECAQRQDLVERFFSEARAVNLIRHESIVNVLDLSTLPDGRPYIVMEYLDGAPLAGIVEQVGALPLGGLARLIAEVLDALGAAHAKGIVHRDLKPDNIYVTPAGRPKVLDFGIAKLHQNLGAGSATQTGSLLGTPHYMSPEQAMGRNVDLRTDIYAIGIILYECATGRRPFNAESLFDLLRKHVDEPPPPPRTLRPDLPPLYEQVILRALAKNPDERWPSGNHLSQALQQATHGLPGDQWLTITPATVGAMAAQRTPMSWPTGPQSWPGQGTPQPMPAPQPHTPVPHQGVVSTVSSGQVMPPPAAAAPTRAGGGGKGPLIGVIALLLVAGAGVGVYFATRGGGGGAAASAKHRGGGEGDPGEDVVAEGEDPDEEADPVEVEPDENDDEADPDLDKLDERIEEMTDRAEKQLEEAGAQLGKVGDLLGKAPDPNAGSGGGGTGGSGGTGGGGGPVTYSVDTVTPLDLPPGFDPKAFDVSGYYATAELEAKRLWPDARLVRIDADGVRPTGMAELTLDDDFYVRYWFRSDTASKRPADLPVGVEWETKCNVQVWIEPDGIKLIPFEWDCDSAYAPAPKCTFEAAWKKAIKLGAPSGNAVSSVMYSANIVTGKVEWYFDIGEWSESFPDNC